MKDSPTQSHVLQLSHPPIPVVRIGIIGLGNRGLLTLQRYLQIEGIEINALFVKSEKETWPKPNNY